MLVLTYSRVKMRADYTGETLPEKERFYTWAEKNSDFLTLYRAWADSLFDKRLMPVLSQKKKQGGFMPANCRWEIKGDRERISYR